MTIQQQLEGACRAFVSDILAILGGATVEELVALSAVPAPAPRASTPKHKAHLAEIGRMPLACPVPDCTGRGVRSKKNFCLEHAASLDDAEKERLRDAQRAARRSGAQAG